MFLVNAYEKLKTELPEEDDTDYEPEAESNAESDVSGEEEEKVEIAYGSKKKIQPYFEKFENIIFSWNRFCKCLKLKISCGCKNIFQRFKFC